MTRGLGIAVTAVPLMYQCAEMTRSARGRGRARARARQTVVKRFTCKVFIGLPWPMKTAGIRAAFNSPTSRRDRRHARCTNGGARFELGGPGRTRTYDQGIRLIPEFPRGADYLFTRERVDAFGRVRDARRLSSRALQLSGSLCTFRRCTAGLAQGCHQPHWKVSLNSS